MVLKKTESDNTQPGKDGLQALQNMGSEPDRKVKRIAREAYYELRKS